LKFEIRLSSNDWIFGIKTAQKPKIRFEPERPGLCSESLVIRIRQRAKVQGRMSDVSQAQGQERVPSLLI